MKILTMTVTVTHTPTGMSWPITVDGLNRGFLRARQLCAHQYGLKVRDLEAAETAQIGHR